MRTTLNIDDDLLKKAARLAGVDEKTSLVKLGLEALIGVWTGTRPADDPGLRVLLALFVLVNGWGHANAMALVGLGALRFTAIVLLTEAALVLSLQIALVPIAGVSGYVGALAIGAVVIPGWLLPSRVRRHLSVRTSP